MFRQRLITYKGMTLTADTVEGLKQLEERAHQAGGWRVLYDELPSEITPESRHLSLLPAGREVRIRLCRSDVIQPEAEISASWGFAIPLGFTPLLRYPLPDPPRDRVFHFLGPWQVVLDNLFSEGKGESAWASVCAAAQTDVGAWAGNSTVERFVQAQFHRIGFNVGPIDGQVTHRTTRAIESLGLASGTFAQAVEYLKAATPPRPTSAERSQGHFSLPGWSLQVASFGQVQTVRTPTGVAVAVHGPGRLVVDIGRPT